MVEDRVEMCTEIAQEGLRIGLWSVDFNFSF